MCRAIEKKRGTNESRTVNARQSKEISSPQNTLAKKFGPGVRQSRGLKHGVSLLSSLVIVMLLTGVALVLQSQAFATATTNKTLINSIEDESFFNAVDALLRPTGAEIFLSVEPADLPPLDGTPIEYTVLGRSAFVSFQDVGGLVDVYRTNVDDARQYLSKSEFDTFLRIREANHSGFGFRQSLGSVDAPGRLYRVFTNQSQLSQVSPETLSHLMPSKPRPSAGSTTDAAPSLLRITINRQNNSSVD